MRRVFWGFLIGWTVACAAGPAAAETPDRTAASNLIAQVTQDAVAALTSKQLSAPERANSVRGLIARYSSAQKLSEEILGRAWMTASDQDRARFETSFVNYVVALCTGMVKDMSPETRIQVKSAEPAGERIVVHSVLVAADDQAPVDWVVAATADGRLVLVDVSTEGVSLIRTMRSDFRAVLFANSGKLEALIAAMNHKANVVAN